MFFLKKKPKTSLGLDIGTSAIKLVELEKEEGRYKLKTYGISPITEYLKHLEERLWLEPSKTPEQEVVEIIKAVIKEAKAESRKVCLSVPVYSSFSTVIDLPSMPEKEIGRAMPFEAKKYVPVPISEVILDWSIIEKIGNQKPRVEELKINKKERPSDIIQILLVAVPKKVVDRYFRIIKSAGLESETLEAETFSLARSLVGNDKSAIALVDIGARSTNISIIDNGYIRVVHNLEIGGAKMTIGLSGGLNVGFEKAEELKKNNRVLLPGEVEFKKIAYPVLDMIIAEIRKVINHYQMKYNRRLEKCILAGGAATFSGLMDYFTAELGLEVSLGNSFARIAYLPVLEPAIKELGPSLAVAVGLAMRE